MSDQDFQELQDEDNKEPMIAVRVYLTRNQNEEADRIARDTGISKSELLRHATFHGLSVYAERLNKYKVNKNLNK